MARLVMFCILAAVILGSAIMCVTTKRIMRAATFLLFVLFGVAGIYLLLDYTFLGAAQISIYAGGITMMYIFAIQLVSKRTLQGLEEHVKGSRVLVGALAALIGFGTVMIVFFKTNISLINILDYFINIYMMNKIILIIFIYIFIYTIIFAFYFFD